METIKLADNKEYQLSPFNVGDLIEIEKKYGNIELDSNKIEPVIYYLWLSIKKKHKDITLDKLYELIDMPFMSEGGLNKTFGLLSKLNGWDKLKNVTSPVEKK
jgi:hypothetical protein